VADAERGLQFLLSHEGKDDVRFVRYLNAFEVMEKHNMTGAQPPIRRAALWAIDGAMVPGILRAYDTCCQRKLAGVYDLPATSA
jgi:hypothetical protein